MHPVRNNNTDGLDTCFVGLLVICAGVAVYSCWLERRCARQKAAAAEAKLSESGGAMSESLVGNPVAVGDDGWPALRLWWAAPGRSSLGPWHDEPPPDEVGHRCAALARFSCAAHGPER